MSFFVSKEFKLSKVSSVPSFWNPIKSQHFTQLPVVVFHPSLVLQMLKIVQLCVTIVMSCLNWWVGYWATAPKKSWSDLLGSIKKVHYWLRVDVKNQLRESPKYPLLSASKVFETQLNHSILLSYWWLFSVRPESTFTLYLNERSLTFKKTLDWENKRSLSSFSV